MAMEKIQKLSRILIPVKNEKLQHISIFEYVVEIYENNEKITSYLVTEEKNTKDIIPLIAQNVVP